MFIVSGEVIFTDVQIVILVQLPKLTVYDIEMFIRKEVRHLIDVLLHFKKLYSLQNI